MIRFKNNSKNYSAEIFGEGIDLNTKKPLINPLKMFRILDSNGKPFAYVTFTVSMLTYINWIDPDKNPLPKHYMDIALINLLNHLPFDPTSASARYVKGNYCMEYRLSNEDSGYVENGSTYNIKVDKTFYEVAQEVIFGPEITNSKVQRKILEVLDNFAEEKPDSYLEIPFIQLQTPVDSSKLSRNLNILEEEGKIQINCESGDKTKKLSAKITAMGTKIVDGSSNIAQTPTVGKQIFGPNIEISTTGNYSPVNVSIGDIDIAFNEILKEIKDKKLPNEKEITELVEQVHKEIKKGKDPNKLLDLLKTLGNAAGWVSKEILSNPAISPILSTLLASHFGVKLS